MKAEIKAPTKRLSGKPMRFLWHPAMLSALVLFVAVSVSAQGVDRVSVRTDGGQGNARSSGATTNEDGSCVVFYSDATNLLPRGEDNNARTDVFLFDRNTREIQRVSVSTEGEQANGPSQAQGFLPAVNADCSCVAFSSDATNLVPDDTNGRTDVFVRDLVTGVTERVSVGYGGAEADGASFFPSVSGDCRHVAFQSSATNLVPDDENAVSDIFVYDRVSGETKLVSVGSDGTQGNLMSISPSISADGSCVAFASAATTFSRGDINDSLDIFVACGDRITCLASISSDGALGDSDSFHPSLTADGQLVAFKSLASNLVPGDINAAADVFVHNCGEVGETEIISVTTSGVAADDHNFPPSISADGRFVAFGSFAHNLAEGQNTRGYSQIYVRDRVQATTMVISKNMWGGPANGSSPDMPPSISLDGHFVAFASLGSNLVSRDTNEAMDAFIGPNYTATPTRTPTPMECETDGDCPDGQVCVGGLCATMTPTPTATPTITCDDDEDCPDGQICVDGICEFPPPTNTPTNTATPTPPFVCCIDLDCPLDHVCTGEPDVPWCQGSVCETIGCETDEDCPGGRICEDGICQPIPMTPTPLPTCVTDDDCAPPDRCRAGVCVPPRGCDDDDPVLDRVNCRGARETCMEGTCECGGDCNVDGNVFGNEISIAVGILGDPDASPLSNCPAADIIFPLDGEVMGNEITLAVLNLGLGCPGEGLPLEILRSRTEEIRTLEIMAGAGAPGGQMPVGVGLSGGGDVATAQLDMLFPDVLRLPDLAKQCVLDPRLQATHSLIVFRPQRPVPPAGVARARFLVADLVFPVESFDDGPLFACDFEIAPGADEGTYPFTGERLNIGDAGGSEFGAEVEDGTGDIVQCVGDGDCPDERVCDEGVCRPVCEVDEDCPFGMSCRDGLCYETECDVPADCEENPREACVEDFCECTGDCNTDGSVFGNEITIAVRILGGEESLDACYPIDANGDGEVFANEITLAVINLGEGCPSGDL